MVDVVHVFGSDFWCFLSLFLFIYFVDVCLILALMIDYRAARRKGTYRHFMMPHGLLSQFTFVWFWVL